MRGITFIDSSMSSKGNSRGKEVSGMNLNWSLRKREGQRKKQRSKKRLKPEKMR